MTAFGSYTLGRKIGAGGMGEVFLATRVSDSAQVVIKRVLPGLVSQSGFVDRFLDEVRVLARLQHPHVVRVFDFGEVNGQWFIAMEFVDGAPVGALDLQRTGRLGFEIASALDAAHSLRDAAGKSTPIVHRDVSPQNILLRASDGAAKLIDFGIASLGGKGAGGGKLGYAAPEQLLEDEASPLSDQYSLGVVLWECLAGRRAFDGEDVEVIRLVTEVGVDALPASALSDTVMRMCSLDPRSRYASMSEVVGAFRKFASISVSPLPGPLPRGREGVGVRAALQELSAVESAALGCVADGMTFEEAERAIEAAGVDGFALDLLEDLISKGALVAEDRDGVRRFKR
ncbi:MAG: serine/threonine protein kinase [Archangium sp.]|nr:serine/threonine protein kinase [Archangium sp.]